MGNSLNPYWLDIPKQRGKGWFVYILDLPYFHITKDGVEAFSKTSSASLQSRVTRSITSDTLPQKRSVYWLPLKNILECFWTLWSLMEFLILDFEGHSFSHTLGINLVTLRSEADSQTTTISSRISSLNSTFRTQTPCRFFFLVNLMK